MKVVSSIVGGERGPEKIISGSSYTNLVIRIRYSIKKA